MKRFLLACCFSLASALAVAAPTKVAGVSFSFDGAPVSQILRVIFVEAYRDKPYFLDPAVLLDQRAVAFRYSPKDGDFRPFLTNFLHELGYIIEQRNGADFVRPLPQSEKPSIAEDPSMELFYYRPKHRDGSYLVELLTPLFKGRFTSQRAVSSPVASSASAVSMSSPGATGGSAGTSTGGLPVAPSGSALAQIDRNIDQLLFAGSAVEVSVLKKLLPQVDTDVGQVMVSGAVYEVQTGDHHGSALGLAGSLLGGKLKLSLGTATAADNFISFQAADMTAIMQALDSDTRFKVLSSPRVRVASGKSASFTVGEQVPVLGSITYPQGGSTPVQSVEYRPSGVIFSISPVVHDEAIDVHVDQSVSSFMATSTGVNNTPTQASRQLATDVSVSDGEVIVIGGLRQNRSAGSNTGLSFLPSWFDAKTADASNTEILLFLRLKRL